MNLVAAFVAFAATAAWLHWKKGALAKSGAYLMGAYATSLLCACVVARVEGRQTSTGPTLYFLAIILFFIAPLVSTKAASQANCPPPEWQSFLTPLSWTMACIGSYATATILPSAVRTLLSGRIAEDRQAMYLGYGTDFAGVALSSQLASGVWPACLVLLVLAILNRRPAVLLIALAFGSISGSVQTLAVAGRAGIVYLFLFLGLLTTLVWPTIVRHRPLLRRKMAVGMGLGCAALAVVTFYLAVMRGFGSNSAMAAVSNNPVVNAAYSLVLYLGSAILNFEDFWYIHDDFGLDLGGQRSFPVFYGILERLGIVDDYSAVDIMVIYKPIYDAHQLEQAVFCGFQRELVSDFGKWGALVGSAAWAALGWLVRRRYEERIDSLSCLTMAFFGSVPLLGIFFLSYGETSGNVSLLAMSACIGLLWLTRGKARRTHLERPANPATQAFHDGGGRQGQLPSSLVSHAP